jgi:radical SAM/Cys-rich protein
MVDLTAATSLSKRSFSETLALHQRELVRAQPQTLQLNIGKKCNLTCAHCHVNAGPNRKEMMTSETVDRVLAWLEPSAIDTVDLTGGTPEMLPDFQRLVRTLRRDFVRPRRVMDRLNATILNEPGYEGYAEFLAEHEVELIASMPCYAPENVTAQRGEGVFDSSIRAFQKLNALGYGRDPRLPLHFVYNPLRAVLPPDQVELEADYKRELHEHFGIVFNQLYCLANMPIARFASQLKHQGAYEEYLQLLRESFNPATIDGLMCRTTINVSWEGQVYDCDFNQMLNLHLSYADDVVEKKPLFLWDLDPTDFTRWQATPLRTGAHCFGCTAGSGSSCGGALL